MKTLLLVALAMLMSAPMVQALANDGACSTRAIAGQWVFATNVGRQMLGEPFPPEKDITAIGTMNIDRHGNVSGTFDVTVQDFAFIPGIPYNGSVTVNPDCTGILDFVTGVGSQRTDSIVVVNRREMLGMSQDPQNLWNYQVRRIANHVAGDDDD